jgi:hypothetical protein
MTLVERLREGPFGLDPSKAMAEGADRIEELEAALRKIEEFADSDYARDVARAALEERK